MINNELKKTILSIYGIEPQPESKSCFICQIFNEKHGLAINAHSISKTHNLIGKNWKTFKHDNRNSLNKEEFLDYKVLESITPKSASVSLSICDYHDKRFNIFEQKNIVDYDCIEHLNLLKIRTMIYFYYKAQNDISNLEKRKNLIIDLKTEFIKNKKKPYYKNCLKNLELRINYNNTIIDNLSYLDEYVKYYWTDTVMAFDYFENFEEVTFLEHTKPLIVIPLQKLIPIVGSFFLSNKQVNKFLKMNFNLSENDFLDVNYMFEYEEPNNEWNSFCEEDYPLIFINIINNNNNPFLLFMGNYNQDSVRFLFKLFRLFLFSNEDFNKIFIEWISLSQNVYFEESLLKIMNDEDINKLMHFHNEKVYCLTENYKKTLTQAIKYDEINSYLKYGGHKFRSNSIIENKPVIEVLNWQICEDPLDKYIVWNFRIGSGHSYFDCLSLLGHSDYTSEDYVLSVGRSSTQNFLFYEIINITTMVDSLEDCYYYNYMPEDDDSGNLLPEYEQDVNTLKNKCFNSRFGKEYFYFLKTLPTCLEIFLQEEICKVNNKKFDLSEYVDILDFYTLNQIDFIHFLQRHAIIINSPIVIIDKTTKDFLNLN